MSNLCGYLLPFHSPMLLFEIPSGILGDRIGPKALFIRIVLFWSLFTALTGLATGLVSLIIIRFLFGMGESGTYTNCMIVVSRWFPVQEIGRSLTWVDIGSQIGSAIAPLIIIPIAIAYGWRTTFYVNALIGFVWVMICYRWFKNFPAQMKKIKPEEFLPPQVLIAERVVWIFTRIVVNFIKVLQEHGLLHSSILNRLRPLFW